jgi:hypothetical protein
VIQRLPVERFRGCPSCGGERRPMPPSLPPPIQTAPPTPSVTATSQQGPRYGAIALIVVAVLVAIVIGISHSSPSAPAANSSSVVTPTKESTSAEQATTSAREVADRQQTEAENRVRGLTFQCIERYVCQVDSEGHALPVFIDGMDENLRLYLQNHGYTDEWSDSGGQIHGQTIGPNSEPYGGFGWQYVSHARETAGPTNNDDPASVETGMLYAEGGEHGEVEAHGVIPWDMHGNTQWQITWTLKNSSGATVKVLRYSVPLVVCEGQVDAYCSRVRNFEDYAHYGESLSSGEYSQARYAPPSAFPKPPSEEGE